jgi:hypothetical protein
VLQRRHGAARGTRPTLRTAGEARGDGGEDEERRAGGQVRAHRRKGSHGRGAADVPLTRTPRVRRRRVRPHERRGGPRRRGHLLDRAHRAVREDGGGQRVRGGGCRCIRNLPPGLRGGQAARAPRGVCARDGLLFLQQHRRRRARRARGALARQQGAAVGLGRAPRQRVRFFVLYLHTGNCTDGVFCSTLTGSRMSSTTTIG